MICRRYVAATATVETGSGEEPEGVTEAPLLIPADETDESSESVSDDADKHDETATVTASADEVASHTELLTGN